MELHVFEPDYYGSFACLMGRCRHSCCGEDWKIPLTKTEYEELLAAQKPPELQALVEKSMVLSQRDRDPSEFARLAIGVGRPCPLQDERGLCRLHAVCGPQVLGYVCRTFPRRQALVLGRLERCCSAGCQAVVHLLWDKGDKLRLVSVPLEPQDRDWNRGARELPRSAAQARPALLCLDSLRTLALDMLQDSKHTLDRRLEALAHAFYQAHLLELAGDRQGLEQLAVQGAQWPQEPEPAQPRAALSTGVFMSLVLWKGNPTQRRLAEEVFGQAGVRLRQGPDGGMGVELSMAMYEEACARRDRILAGGPRFLEHLLVNYWFQSLQPFGVEQLSIWENVQFFCGLYSLLKLVLAGCAAGGREAMEDGVVAVMRKFTHADAMAIRTAGYFAKTGIDTPQKLARLFL